MTYVIAAPCIADYSCVEACPADCIGPRPDDPDFDAAEQLYIDPRQCIDCNACAEACPVDAAFHEWDLPERWINYLQVNADYYEQGLR